MPATDQPALDADETDDMTGREGLAADFPPGSGLGEAEAWDIYRVHCPECRRPIALVADEERLPEHALLPTAWNPFAPAICPGSGTLTDDLAEVETPEESGPVGFGALFKPPGELDWRTQPFSHAVLHRPVRAAAAVESPVKAAPLAQVSPLRSVPEQRRRMARAS
ncbi:hypothetical protein ACIBCA_29280 [Kitasatospora sp. NPDC051170]|uniref:hypothetical protein n=1 Tax=Kitasatospora sp. NPDC051170 TaxID=3364056 RepID=UPI0037A1AEC0